MIVEEMKIFTVDEANDMLPVIIPKLTDIRSHSQTVSRLRDAAKRAAKAAESGGGGTEHGSMYITSLVEIGKLTTEVIELGVQIKDYTRGLIDFPTMRAGKLVLLCWQLDEPPVIEWWHDLEGGFAGRQRL
ncbi:MAG: DUF2203 domain-containing protein [Pyrinomonadaceae bacterium]|nr:DUF2203 domain-containing protein [Pyrinomonadaceae bacterium]